MVRLRGKGVTRKGRAPGDLFVHFLVHVPTGGDEELVRLVDAIAAFDTGDPREGIAL